MSECPECGSDEYEETTMGWWHFRDKNGIEHSHDPNRKTCCKCNYVWYDPCLSCGETRDNVLKTVGSKDG